MLTQAEIQEIEKAFKSKSQLGRISGRLRYSDKLLATVKEQRELLRLALLHDLDCCPCDWNTGSVMYGIGQALK